MDLKLYQIMLVFCICSVSMFCLSCSNSPTKVTIRDDNQDQVAHLAPSPDLLGNTEIFFIPATI